MMLLEDLVLPVFITGLFFIIVLSILAILVGKTLQKMPNNENEISKMDSWTGPERSSYIATIAVWLLFIVSSILLASDDKVLIILGIGLILFGVLILATASILAFAVMQRKNSLTPQFLPTT